jgi:LysR family tcuABC transcriptional regulator
VTVLPSLISVNDIASGDLVINPIADPPLYAEFVVIQPARRTLSTQARLFLERFEAEIAHILNVWDRAIGEPAKRSPGARRSVAAE